MRWSALILVLGFLFAPSSLSAQQVTFSESDAQNNLNAMAAGANGCWVYFRLGEYKFIITEAAQGGSMYEQAQNLLALKGIGVINWIDLESMLGWAHFKIELRPDVDQAEVMSLQINNMACLKVSTSPEVYKILKVENVKGGHTNWDGAVVYATVQTTPTTPLYDKFVAARNIPSMASRKVRYLFKYDIFKKDWSFRAADVAPLNAADFNTQRVPMQLQQD
jgi:hypothetical protein